MPSNQPDRTAEPRRRGTGTAGRPTGRRERAAGEGAVAREPRRSKGPRGRPPPDNFDNFIIDKIPPKLPARLKLYVNSFDSTLAAPPTVPPVPTVPRSLLARAHTLLLYDITVHQLRYTGAAHAGSDCAFGKFKSDLIYVANYTRSP